MLSDEKTKEEKEEINLGWLYLPNFKSITENWLAEQAT